MLPANRHAADETSKLLGGDVHYQRHADAREPSNVRCTYQRKSMAVTGVNCEQSMAALTGLHFLTIVCITLLDIPTMYPLDLERISTPKKQA